ARVIRLELAVELDPAIATQDARETDHGRPANMLRDVDRDSGHWRNPNFRPVSAARLAETRSAPPALQASQLRSRSAGALAPRRPGRLRRPSRAHGSARGG